MQPVLLLQCAGNVLAAATDEAVADLASRLVHRERYDMQVVAVNVLVFEHGIGLVAVTEPCEVLLGNSRQLRIGQTVVGMRIEGDMHHGLRRAYLLRQVAGEVLRSLPDVEASRPLVEDFVRGKQASLPLVYLLAVVGQRPVKGVSYVNFGNHCC
ncbi:putative uncharacterized protein [Bacteroides fragilis CAG:558]|nr:putative uncharacterized protein [Bacteroides fragilis CAG:558]